MTPAEMVDLAFPFVVGAAGLRIVNDLRKPSSKLGKAVLPPVGGYTLLDRFWYPMSEPISVGNGLTDWYETHMRMVAMSGGYKTTLMSYLARQRIEAGRSVVVLTGGDSDQLEAEIRAHGGWVFRPGASALRFNPFQGEPKFMAQTWASFFPTTSKAMVYHSAFELAALAYFQQTSPRRYSVGGLKEFVLTYDPPPPSGNPKAAEHSKALWSGMKEGYGALRLELMDQFLGDWIGPELSIDYCVKRKIPVMFVLDSADDPDVIRLSAALVWGAICYAVHHTGGIDAFVDEFGRLPVDLVNNQIRTWRRNKSHLVAASHKIDDFHPVLEDMFHINCLGIMVSSATETRSKASDITWGTVHETGFGAHALGKRWSRLDQVTRNPRKGYFWLVDLHRVQEVSVPAYQPVKEPWQRHSIGAYLLRECPFAVSGKRGGTGGGSAATDKADRAVLGSGSPAESGGVLGTADGERQSEQQFMAELYGRQHGPPEMPTWMELKQQTRAWWAGEWNADGEPIGGGLSFPYGALDEKSCWHTTLAKKGKGQRPGCQFSPAPGLAHLDWQAYDLFKALAEAEQHGIIYETVGVNGERAVVCDAKLLAAWLAYVKLHLKTGSLSGDHLCEKWRGTQGKLCIRPLHVEWEDKLVNSELHWERLREREDEAA